MAAKEKLYETMGDAATAVRSLDKAVHYYRQMLACAEETGSGQLSAALTSLAETLRDAGKPAEGVPYARRELELDRDPRERCSSALYLAGLLTSANAPSSEVRTAYERALTLAKECEDRSAERNVVKELLAYLQDLDEVDPSEIEQLNEKLESLPESQAVESEEEEETETQEIGAEICLDELSDVDEEPADKTRNVCKTSSRRNRCVVKRNEKGETLLHVACIKGTNNLFKHYLLTHW